MDRLHKTAGSKNIIELHGSIWTVRCTDCKASFDTYKKVLSQDPRCDRCQQRLRPGVVWFGEMLPDGAMEKAAKWAHECDVFLVIGTSATVYPAAGLAMTAKNAGGIVIEINLEETPATDVADLSIFGPSGQIIPRLVQGLGLS